jgi:signal transduction histidine kinase
VAEQAVDTAGRITGGDSTPSADASGQLTEQLAKIAEGMAEVTAKLAEERRDADVSLDQERNATDRIVGQELEQVETRVADEVREEREVLREDREATDDNLADERQHTDGAVDHVLELLAEERREHAVAQRGVSTRNEFLTIVSHDLRGPLMTIAGLASLIEQQAPADGNGRRIRGWADRIHRSVGVMERLIADLLDFGSFEDGQLRVLVQSLDARALIRDAVDAFQTVAAVKLISLGADLPGEPLMVKCDHDRMLQVLSNIIHNAIKFTPEGGTVRIHAERLDTDCLVSVADTGIGIPKGELTSIFERFRQIDRPDRTGFGLGLYISRFIVEAHRGRIWAESEVGAGTTFYFTMPEG